MSVSVFVKLMWKYVLYEIIRQLNRIILKNLYSIITCLLPIYDCIGLICIYIHILNIFEYVKHKCPTPSYSVIVLSINSIAQINNYRQSKLFNIHRSHPMSSALLQFNADDLYTILRECSENAPN